MIGELPARLDVNGKSYAIRTDMKDVLKILQAFGDPELKDEEKVYICLVILYRDFDEMPQSDYEAAYKAAAEFIDCGLHSGADKGRPTPRTMDWEQDAPILFPAINRVAGCEVRNIPHLHWWTFMGYFMEIHDGTFAQVMALRSKKAKGKKLEKWEREYYDENRELIDFKSAHLTDDEDAFIRQLMTGGVRDG